MEVNQTNNMTAPQQTFGNEDVFDRSRKFQVGLSMLGAVGAVVFAATTHRKGKFWWFVGGSIAGTALGFMIDSMVKK